MYPLYLRSFRWTFLIVPATRPASEFQLTWSPTLNVCVISDSLSSTVVYDRRQPLQDRQGFVPLPAPSIGWLAPVRDRSTRYRQTLELRHNHRLRLRRDKRAWRGESAHRRDRRTSLGSPS